MIDDQRHVLQTYAGLLAGFIVGFWRGLALVQQEMEKLATVELDRLTSSLIGMQPLGQSCFYACVGYWLCWMLYEFTGDRGHGEMIGTDSFVTHVRRA